MYPWVSSVALWLTLASLNSTVSSELAAVQLRSLGLRNAVAYLALVQEEEVAELEEEALWQSGRIWMQLHWQWDMLLLPMMPLCL